ncbi:exosortase-associated protein EpsI, B-type [Dechloromonas sp. ARDL1]|uniref:exosortase-associated protein EpsI, B-type n=1 Tax=Dechloromonas sp. ARDL1 TaxID=3322121 RepID=UPI003DA6F61B
MKPLFRNLILVISMVSASGLAIALRPTERIADHAERISLEEMIPPQFGEWREDKSIVPIEPAPELKAVIDKTYDQTLSRTFIDASGNRIMLSIAYGGNQHEGMNTHRPEICYPAQGFELISSRPDTLMVLGRALPLHRVIAKMSQRNEPISYWVVVGDELTEFGLKHKLTTLKYGISGRIPDGMLIRVSSIDRDEQQAYRLQDKFINAMLSALSQKDQSRLLGTLPN